MKEIKDILSEAEILEVNGDTSSSIGFLTFDSRKAGKDSLFFAITGNLEDGNRYIKDAIERGAQAVVFEGECSEKKKEDVTYIKVKSTRKALAMIAEAFYDHPSKKLKLIGVTGTNGKTTTATLLFDLFRSLGYHVALISTVENRIDDKVFPVTHTTPDPISVSMLLNDAVQSGCEYAFMECSSHAIDQERIAALQFAGGIFTNLTHDHLDYHGTIEEYAKAKKRFFDMLPSSAFALANHDDLKGEYMLSETKAKKYFLSLASHSSFKPDFTGELIETSLKGLKMLINGKEIKTKLIGSFNAYNILGIFATANLLGIPEEKIISTLSTLTPPKGRLEFVESKEGVYGVVDYAHSPDALENILKALNAAKTKGSRIISVVGCGGDRDKTKRPIMGKIASSLSDHVFFTSDNPRSEDPEAIIKDIVAGVTFSMKNYETESDRREAIRKASKMAKKGDIVLIAGKGHEPYQIFKDRTIHFSDIEEVREQLGIAK